MATKSFPSKKANVTFHRYLSTHSVDLVLSTSLVLLIVIKNVSASCHVSWIADSPAKYM